MAENKNGLTLFIGEDWMAVCLGFIVIAAVLVGVRPPLPKYSWATDGEFATAVAENKPAVENLINEAQVKREANLAALGSRACKGHGRRRPQDDRGCFQEARRCRKNGEG